MIHITEVPESQNKRAAQIKNLFPSDTSSIPCFKEVTKIRLLLELYPTKNWGDKLKTKEENRPGLLARV